MNNAKRSKLNEINQIRNVEKQKSRNHKTRNKQETKLSRKMIMTQPPI